MNYQFLFSRKSTNIILSLLKFRVIMKRSEAEVFSHLPEDDFSQKHPNHQRSISRVHKDLNSAECMYMFRHFERSRLENLAM